MIEGYREAKASKYRRLIVNLEGEDKVGKTTFGLSASSPIAILNMDRGDEGVVDKYLKKRIQIADFHWRDASNPAEWLKMWENVKEAYTGAVKSKEIRTIVWDTATEAWELLRLARFGKLSGTGENIAYWYGPINAEFKNLIDQVYSTDKNLVLIHKLKDKYIKNQRTGEMERAGFGGIGGIVQINLRGWYKDGQFGITIRNCRQNMDLAGMELVGEMSNFSVLATMIYPDTTLENWK